MAAMGRQGLAELRALSNARRKGYENQAAAGIADTAFGSTVEIPADTFDALLNIAEAAQAVAHEAEFYADDDTPDDSLIVVTRADMKKLDEALAKVRP